MLKSILAPGTIMALLLSFAINSSAAAAEYITIDKKAIEQTVVNTPDVYRSLLERFVNGDNTLTQNELAIVYYGSALQPGFNPDVQYSDMLAAFSSADYARALDLCKRELVNDPTNLTLLFKAYACSVASSDEATKAAAPKYQTRLLQICDLIFYSGKGVITEDPFVVTRRSDMDEVVVKYIQPVKILGTSPIGNLIATKVQLEGIPDDVIMYFKIF